MENSLPLNVSMKLLNGTMGLFDPQHIAVFFDKVANGEWDALQSMWGLTPSQFLAFTIYFMDTALDVSLPKLEKLLASGSQEHRMNSQGLGSGLVTSRPVFNWIWDAPDPLLELLQPENPNVRLQRNYSSEQDTFQNQRVRVSFILLSDVAFYSVYGKEGSQQSDVV